MTGYDVSSESDDEKWSRPIALAHEESDAELQQRQKSRRLCRFWSLQSHLGTEFFLQSDVLKTRRVLIMVLYIGTRVDAYWLE